MKWWKNKCKMCQTRYDGDGAEVQINTSEGLLTIRICDNCADFLDDSADMMRRKKDDESL